MGREVVVELRGKTPGRIPDTVVRRVTENPRASTQEAAIHRRVGAQSVITLNAVSAAHELHDFAVFRLVSDVPLRGRKFHPMTDTPLSEEPPARCELHRTYRLAWRGHIDPNAQYTAIEESRRRASLTTFLMSVTHL